MAPRGVFTLIGVVLPIVRPRGHIKNARFHGGTGRHCDHDRSAARQTALSSPLRFGCCVLASLPPPAPAPASFIF